MTAWIDGITGCSSARCLKGSNCSALKASSSSCSGSTSTVSGLTTCRLGRSRRIVWHEAA